MRDPLSLGFSTDNYRHEDFRKVIPKLSVFGGEEGSKIREQVEAKVKTLTEDELAKQQEFLKTANA